MATAAFEGGVYSNAEIKDNEWHMVTAVLEQGETFSENIKLYIDGQLNCVSYDFACTINTLTDNISVNIGAWEQLSGFERFFEGAIDDVRIYDRALALEEIEQLYTIPEPATIMLLGLGRLVLRKRRG